MEISGATSGPGSCFNQAHSENKMLGSEVGETQFKEDEEYPRLSDSDRLALFGGDEHLLAYYLGLREALTQARQQGGPCLCDPRDTAMRARVEQEGWEPRVTLKDLRDDGSADFEFTSKQTALEDKKAGDLLGSDGDDDNDAADGEQPDLEHDGEEDAKSFVCGVHGCSARFTSLASHESHYHTCHSFVCQECRRTFVSDFLLDVHLEENHDSYFQVLSPRVDMYRCLVESCSLKFRTSDVRKDHLVTVHKFPARFSFHAPITSKRQKARPAKAKSRENGSINNNGISNNSMETSDLITEPTSLSSSSPSPSLPPQPPVVGESPRSSPAAMEMDLKEGEGHEEISTEGPVRAKGRGQQRNRGRGSRGTYRGRGRGGRVPSSICFGRGSQRAFQPRGGGSRGRHWHQTQGMDVDTTVDIEKVDFTDMAESLEGGV